MSNMDAFSNIPQQQEAEFRRHLDDTEIKDSLRLYNILVESCFDKCVAVGYGGGFRSKNLETEESKCVTECAQKFMKMTQRVGLRMGEYQFAKSQLQQRK